MSTNPSASLAPGKTTKKKSAPEIERNYEIYKRKSI